tara:strand:+ start:1138 stop:1941 length:804 start_codon:yes stop_codon:yes gene_type:complete
MSKFKYKKWVTDYKHGLLNEQQLGDTPPYDGIVNNTDLTYVNNNWMQPGDVYDSNDGIVNNDDLTLVNNNWLQGQITGSGTGSAGINCYACVGGQLITTSSLTYGLMDSGFLSGYAGAAGSDYCGTVSNLPTIPNYGFFFTSMAGLTALSGSCGTGSGTGSACDTSPTSQCAQTWFGTNASNFTNFMSNKSCTGSNSYQGVINHLSPQISTLWQNRPNQNVTLSGPYNFNDIKTLANDAGFTQPQKGQFKRKAAKRYYSSCMTGSCC